MPYILTFTAIGDLALPRVHGMPLNAAHEYQRRIANAFRELLDPADDDWVTRFVQASVFDMAPWLEIHFAVPVVGFQINGNDHFDDLASDLVSAATHHYTVDVDWDVTMAGVESTGILVRTPVYTRLLVPAAGHVPLLRVAKRRFE